MMDEQKEIVKAIIGDKVILCGYCGHKLAETQNLRCGLGSGTIYLKCVHKDKGIRCRMINQIDL
jgi:hypothetical protein